MFGGEEERVTLHCANDMANAIIDQFGHDTRLIKVDEEYFEAKLVSSISFGRCRIMLL